MRIIVPTYRRHSNGVATTFTSVPKDLPLTVVVREEEKREYAEMLQNLSRTNDTLWIIPPGTVNGIATTRQWIVCEVLGLREKKFVMVDDDLIFATRGAYAETEPGWDYRLVPCEPDDVRAMFKWMENGLNQFAHVAISRRDGNNRTPGLGATDVGARGICCVGYRSEFFLPPHNALFRGELEGREDLDVTLQLLRKGYGNCISYHWTTDQRTADAPGGLEGTRDNAQLRRTAEALVRDYPGFVTHREKTNKGGAMAGTRPEVTIYWKKALYNE